jgi:pimeloyl-ACP methyl ester carboxylesterase
MTARHSAVRRLLAPTVLLSVSAMLLAACSSSSSTTSTVRDQNNDVSFKGCDQVKCTGTLNDAPYEIVLPAKWNGTLLLYSHGYRNAEPAPPDLQPVSTTPEPAPGWGEGAKDVGQALLDQGYALAGSAYKSNGWAVADGVAAGNDLYEFFKSNVATPNRVYVWGDSLGGLITQTMAEKYPWVNGAAPFCGAVAGLVPNMDLALDVAYGIKTLGIYPELKLTGYSSYEEAVQNWTEAAKRLLAAAKDVPNGTSKVLYLAGIVNAPGQTFKYDGSTITSKVSGLVESTLTALGFGTFGRYDVEKRYGGNVSGNEKTDYAARISTSEASSVDTLVPGAAASYTALMQAGQRVAPDPAAVTKGLADGGDPQGTVQVPTLTIHTAADPLVIVENESFLLTRYRKAASEGKTKADLIQLYTVAPSTYPESTGAPFGAGHCNFTKETRVNMIGMLNTWVRDGVTPVGDAITKALPPETTGYAATYVPGPWPDALVQAAE